MRFTPESLIPAIAAASLVAAIAPSVHSADTKGAKAAAPRDVTPDEAERIIKLNPDLVILDVRTSEEFGDGHLPGARNINFFAADFADKMKAYEGKAVLIHCASGGRSGQALQRLKDVSFASIYHLKTGFTGWQAAGKKVER